MVRVSLYRVWAFALVGIRFPLVESRKKVGQMRGSLALPDKRRGGGEEEEEEREINL